MAEKFDRPGDTVTFTAVADTQPDDVVVLGASVGISLGAVASGETGIAKITGVWREMPKAAGTAWVPGTQLSYDISAGAFDAGGTPAAGDLVACAMAAEAAGSADTVGYVLLTPNTGTVQ